MSRPIPPPAPRLQLLHPARSLALALVALLGCATPGVAHAQRLAGFGVEAGPTLAFQRWDDFDQRPLTGYHVALTAEQLDYDRGSGLYAALGYHQRGSAIRVATFQATDPNTGRPRLFQADAIKFVFHNVALAAGARKHYAFGRQRGSVGFGLRGELNVATDFGSEDSGLSIAYGPSFPQSEFVRPLVYGIDLDGAVELPLSPRLDGLARLRISPDLGRQYFQPPVPYYNAFTRQNEIATERRIHNISIELSLGIRFLPRAEFE